MAGDAEEALIRRRPELPLIWLEHPAGGSGAFLMLAEDEG